MRSVQVSGASGALPIIILQSGAIRRRIATSDAVASLVAELCFGPHRRDDLGLIASVTASRVASNVGAR